jgi:hypothetical protein
MKLGTKLRMKVSWHPNLLRKISFPELRNKGVQNGRSIPGCSKFRQNHHRLDHCGAFDIDTNSADDNSEFFVALKLNEAKKKERSPLIQVPLCQPLDDEGPSELVSALIIARCWPHNKKGRWPIKRPHPNFHPAESKVFWAISRGELRFRRRPYLFIPHPPLIGGQHRQTKSSLLRR